MRLTDGLLNSLKSFTVLVTGGSSGLGLATSEKLLQCGCNVVICDINAPSDLEKLGDRTLFLKTDITSESDVSNTLKEAKTRFSSVNALVNCAGIGITRKTINIVRKTFHDLIEFEKVLKVNTLGTFNMISKTAMVMSENTPDEDGQRGVIINTASVAAYEGQVGQAAYSASKAAIVGMTLPIARDLSKHGIRVVTIAPGIFESRLLFGERQPTPQVISYFDNIQLVIDRRGHPEEFASAVLECLENRMLNGISFRLDGGGRLVHI